MDHRGTMGISLHLFFHPTGRGLLVRSWCITPSNYFLRVIPTLTNYADIVSDTPSVSIYCIYIYIHTYVCIIYIYIFWHSFWHIFWHSIWRLFSHSIWNLGFSLTFFSCGIFSVRVQAQPTASGARDLRFGYEAGVQTQPPTASGQKGLANSSVSAFCGRRPPSWRRFLGNLGPFL